MDTNNIINTIVETITKSVLDSDHLHQAINEKVRLEFVNQSPKLVDDKGYIKEVVNTAVEGAMENIDANDISGLSEWIEESIGEHVVEADEVSGLDEFIANQIDSEIESQLNDKFSDMTVPKDNVENLAEELDAMDDKIDDAIARLKVLENGGSSEGRLSEIDRLKVRNEQLETRVGSLEYAINVMIQDLTSRQQEIADQLTNSIEGLKSISDSITKI